MSTNDPGPPSRTQLLQAAMLASFEGKAFDDVKFWVFSRRMRGGIVDQPKSLVANSALVRKATSHFDPVLSVCFSESDLIDMDAPYPSTMRQDVDDYAYTSDSDLESEDDEDLDGQPDSTTHSDHNRVLAALEQATVAIRAAMKLRCHVISTSGIPQSTGSTQRKLQEIAGGLIQELQPYVVNACPVASDGESSTPPAEGSNTGQLACNSDVTPDPDGAAMLSTAELSDVDRCLGRQPKREGRIIYLHDIAFKTWRAFLFYAYFEEVAFAPLKSLKVSHPRIGANHRYGTPLCSPKSMYRLAEKYDIPALKKCALDDVRAQLSPNNILEEVFSSFTTLYPEIQELELTYLYDNIDALPIQKELPTWIEVMEDGRLAKGASRILSSLVMKLTIETASRRPETQPNPRSARKKEPPRKRPECYGPHRHPGGIDIEPDGTQICGYCGGEVRSG